MVQVREGYYVSKKYATLERFITYYYQLDAIRNTGNGSILFVGVGDGVLPYFLRKAGRSVTTLDFDASLEPDIVADLRSLPFEDNSFDVVCVFEVLEHMPFEDSEKAIAEIARVSRSRAIVSVPHRRTGFEMVIKFPYIRSILKQDYLQLALRMPVRFPGFAVSTQHYWEIDWYTTKLEKFRKALQVHFSIEKETTPLLDPYRRFFELRHTS